MLYLGQHIHIDVKFVLSSCLPNTNLPDERFFQYTAIDEYPDNRKDYNNFSMRPLGWKTPNQVLLAYLSSLQHMFDKPTAIR